MCYKYFVNGDRFLCRFQVKEVVSEKKFHLDLFVHAYIYIYCLIIDIKHFT